MAGSQVCFFGGSCFDLGSGDDEVKAGGAGAGAGRMMPRCRMISGTLGCRSE